MASGSHPTASLTLTSLLKVVIKSELVVFLDPAIKRVGLAVRSRRGLRLDGTVGHCSGSTSRGVFVSPTKAVRIVGNGSVPRGWLKPSRPMIDR